ncbi:hypothetical protein J1N35_004256 [Gossypium stocksii]|uniref:Uncharacterized protein n=1 Tax=Gossypium stocksii TaxID=47602 RepID=A0A9D3WBT1_9ROSI|nr:hypothetical protein J1N35_004256 [Gossypium stocksii]
MPSVSNKTEVKTAMEAHIKKIMQADEDVVKIASVGKKEEVYGWKMVTGIKKVESADSFVEWICI